MENEGIFDYDNRLLATVAVKPRVIGDVIGILETIDAICVDQDGLKWFNSLYLRTTPGTYQDAAWLMALDVRFAQFYLDALTGWLSHGEVAEFRRVLLERREQGRTARVQFALAGVNAQTCARRSQPRARRWGTRRCMAACTTRTTRR